MRLIWVRLPAARERAAARQIVGFDRHSVTLAARSGFLRR